MLLPKNAHAHRNHIWRVPMVCQPTVMLLEGKTITWQKKSKSRMPAKHSKIGAHGPLFCLFYTPLWHIFGPKKCDSAKEHELRNWNKDKKEKSVGTGHKQITPAMVMINALPIHPCCAYQVDKTSRSSHKHHRRQGMQSTRKSLCIALVYPFAWEEAQYNSISWHSTGMKSIHYACITQPKGCLGNNQK